MNRENFMQLAPHNDDIWFWAMAILNGTKIKIPEKAIPNILSVDENARNEYALWTLNKQGRSHFQLLQVFKKYPNTHNILIQEIANFKPYISVVIIIKNTDKVLNCINNLIFNQFADYEVLIINTGTRANTAKLPYNFKFINFSGASINSARNLGLSKARGKLILFKEDNNFFITGALANIVRLDSNFNAEIIHCSAHFQTEQNKFQRIADDDTGNIGKDTFVFANENKQLRAVQWFNNKLSRRLDTKIFKRNFLLENNFKFNEGDESEFIFSCLIKAEKYLLTSQAFLYF